MFNMLNNAVCCLLAFTNSRPAHDPVVLAALAVFAVGSFIETFSELQRKAFKDDPRNKGKPFTGGLFTIAQAPFLARSVCVR